MNITLIIRGQEHAQNATKQKFLYDYMRWKYPFTIHTGRLNLAGAMLSKSKIREGIEKGTLLGWDDPRVGTIRALRRRGFQPQAIRRLLIDLGIRPSDVSIEWKSLESYNREIIQEKAEKMVFLEKPIALHANYVPAKEILLHEKKINLTEGRQTFFVEKKTMKENLGKVVRLREAYNVKIESLGEWECSARYTGNTKIKNTVSWILEGRDLEILMPNTSKQYGVTEKRLEEKKEGEIVYLEGKGFVRVDQQKEKRSLVWYTHS
jgi:glutamyl-tRNA synthetase